MLHNTQSDATWNRLTHTDSGHCSNGDMSTGSTQTQSLPPLYQHCSLSTSTPLKTLSRENVLLSPTLPHSLSDHIGINILQGGIKYFIFNKGNNLNLSKLELGARTTSFISILIE